MGLIQPFRRPFRQPLLGDPARDPSLQVGIEQRRSLLLIPGHQVPVAVEGDHHACVPHVGRQGLRVDAGRDHQRGVGVPGVVEADRVELLLA